MPNTSTPDECRKLQPDIELDILGAVHYHCDAHMYPNKLMRGLVKYLEDAGVHIHRNSKVVKVSQMADKITSVSTDNQEFTGDAYRYFRRLMVAGYCQACRFKYAIDAGQRLFIYGKQSG